MVSAIAEITIYNCTSFFFPLGEERVSFYAENNNIFSGLSPDVFWAVITDSPLKGA